ncbi:MAG: gamma-glutamyl-gamma-aminobutyrate hydrolase family protein [Alphaproteobacteria bacterium]|nr:gamma-glutamyl-gamma-aminobutyrate hydrolase family protein [Alphaproteobacteria bacterium]
MPTPSTSPLVGVSASRVTENAHPFHRVTEKYMLGVVDPAGCVPVIVPVLADIAMVDTYAERLDGLLLTGGAANVEPHNYDGSPSMEGTRHDPDRDATMLPLIKRCVELGVPVLGLCLGLQEMNVAFGGTLHQRVFDLTDKFDHRMRRDVDDHDRRYRPAHDISVSPDGVLQAIIGTENVLVNSLHAQGIDRTGERVRVEATAPDGIIEAISIHDAPGFALAVQWHPEWPRPIEAHNAEIFEAFGDACRAYAATRSGAESLAAE